MTLKTRKPMTNGQRQMSYVSGEQLTAKKPRIKKLLETGKKTSGRNNGTISIRHRGGGTRPQYRLVDFNQTAKLAIPYTTKAIEYDPNRTSYIALICYADGQYSYVIAHKNQKVGDVNICDEKAKAVDGNRMQLQNIPVGFIIHNVEMKLNKGGQVARTAGGSAQLVSLDGDKAQVKLSSGEIKYVDKKCFATLGVVSNEEQNQVNIGKAGRVRLSGRRPQVRGKVMNPIDHPHGGGEGRNSIGLRYPKTPWGAHALGVRTRANKRTDKDIALSRHRAKKKR